MYDGAHTSWHQNGVTDYLQLDGPPLPLPTGGGWSPRTVSRIRTIKPDLFRHEALQTLEQNNPGSCAILVFIGLFTACDRLGHFPWEPRQLKLDIFPFLPFDMEKTLTLLMDSHFILRYEVDGRLYGEIPTFGKHQRIAGTESYNPPKYPANPRKYNGSTEEVLEKRNTMETSGKHIGSTGKGTDINTKPGMGMGKGNGKGMESAFVPDLSVPQVCHKCNGMKLVHQLPNIPGPRLIPCPRCSGKAATA